MGGMKILSLFDGMACGMVAMIEADIKVDRYVAFEIDKYAIKTATHNFPMIEQKGDVFTADFTQYAGFDWLVGGSPCTYWSIAQKNGRETEASGMGWELFQQYVRALHEAKPKYFIYENNKSMSKAIRASIDEAFGFEAVFINSALVSAQNRQRLYWVGKRNADGTYSKVNVEQPVDRGILLKDILISGNDLTANDKPYCMTASYDGACSWNTIERNQRTMIAEPVNPTADGKSQTIKAQYQQNNEDNFIVYAGGTFGASGVAEPVAVRCRGRKDKNGNGFAKYECRKDQKSNVVDTNGSLVAEPVNITDEGKSVVLKANYHKSSVANFFNGNEGMKYAATGVAEPLRVGSLPRPNGELSTSQAMRIYSTDGKFVNITSGGGGMGGKTGLYAIPVEFDGDVPTKAVSQADGKTYRVHKVENGIINIKGKDYPIKLSDGYYIIRKLTVRECMRLQTIPEWYEFPVSDAQAYKQIGNGWTVQVIVHLIKACLSGKVEEPEFGEQIKFF